MNEKQDCGDCGTPIWWDDRANRWIDREGWAWCYGPDGSRTSFTQQHAPAGVFPVRVRAAEGERCRCIAANREHVHHLEILPDGAALKPNPEWGKP